MQATVIVNLRSSRSEAHVSRVAELLKARDIEVTDFLIVNDNLKLAKRAKRAVAKGAQVLILGGGDGTMAIGVDALAKRNCTLGVLPLGTGNSFAQTLGISDDLEKAVDVIVGARVACVDLGVVNKTHFANFATIGLSAEIAASTSHELKKIVGAAAYVIGGIKPFFTHEGFRAKLRWDDGRMELMTRQMVIASGRFFGKTPVLPDATITDGTLAFFTTSGISNAEIARMYVAFGLGLQTRLPDAHFFSSKEIIVRTKPKQPISIDGNAFGTTPAHFSVARRALRVFVPPDFVDEGR